MIHSLVQWDIQVFRQINVAWNNELFNQWMPAFRNASTWIPLYLFMILLMVMNFGRNGWWWVLSAVVTVIISNYISSNIVKEFIFRTRPCNEPSIAGWAKILVIYRPQSSSFTSSHATNHFAMAMFVWLTLREPAIKKSFGWWPGLFFGWALLVCYAQVYVGVHYPLDVTGGAILGSGIGYCTAWVFNKRTKLELTA